MKARNWLKSRFNIQRGLAPETLYTVYQEDLLELRRTFFIRGAAESYAKELKEKEPNVIVYLEKNVKNWIIYEHPK